MTILKVLPNEYYMGRLTSEYFNSDNFKAWLQTVLNITYDISQCLISMDLVFDLDYATGVQLDTLGVIIGISRTLPFNPTNASDNPLSDDNYRLLLKATIANNQWDGNIDSLWPIWKTLFPGGTITVNDNQNMTADIFVSGSFSAVIQDMITHGLIVPRPETVQYTYHIGKTPFFGFDRTDSYISGFDSGGFWS